MGISLVLMAALAGCQVLFGVDLPNETGSNGAGGQAAGSAGVGGWGGQGGLAGEAGGVVEVRLLAFNDFHGNLEPLPTLNVITKAKSDTAPEEKVVAGGAAYFAAHVNALRQEKPDHTLIVGAGDMIGASPLTSALFHDEPTIDAMNALGLTVTSVGNHEFDEGKAELLRLDGDGGACHPVDGCKFVPRGESAASYKGAQFPILAANVTDSTTAQPILPPTYVKEVDGAKIAFVGLTLEGTPDVVSKSAIQGLSFADEIETINKHVPGLKAAGADAVVVLVHEGGTQAGLYNECKDLTGKIVDIVNGLSADVDVVVSGHTHQAYNCNVGGKLVTSALSFGRIVTKIDLRIDRATKRVTEKTAENVIVTRDVTPDPLVGGVVDVALASAGPLANRLVGKIAGDLKNAEDPMPRVGETPLGDVIADAQLAATAPADKGDAVIAFMNPGGIRAPLLFDTGDAVADGDVTYGALFTVQPFANYLVTMTLTGAQIETLLEQQITPLGTDHGRILQVSNGFTYTWDFTKVDPATRKVDIDPTTIKLNGVTLDPAGTYRVTVNSFLATGGDGFAVLAAGTDRLDGVVDLEAAEAYFAANQSPPLAVPPANRITRLN